MSIFLESESRNSRPLWVWKMLKKNSKIGSVTLTAACGWSQGRSWRMFCVLPRVIYVQSSLLPLPRLCLIVCFLEEFRISFPINCSPQRDNNQDRVQVSQLVPHTVQVTICLHYEGLSQLLEGLGPEDGKAPTELIFVHKDVWASLEKKVYKSVQRFGEWWRATVKLSWGHSH